MESLTKRIAYLKGLSDGLKIGEDSKEGRIVSEVVLLLDEMLVEMKTLQLRMQETEAYVEAVDEDLNNLELFVYDEDDLYYENVNGDDFIGMEENNEDFYDLDDNEDAYVYERKYSLSPDAANPS